MAESLSNILSDEKPEAPLPAEKPESTVTAETVQTEKPEKPEVERVTNRRREHQRREWTAQGRDPETGQFVPKDNDKKAAAAPDKAAEPPKAAEPAKPPEPPKAAEPAKPIEEMTAKEKAAFATAADERRKRQALEQELARIRSGGQPPAAPQKPKTFAEDPEGFMQRAQHDLRQQGVHIVLDTTERLARARYQDFDEKVAKFSEIVAATPGLAQQWLSSADPAEFAYKTAKNHMELQQVGSLDKIKAEVDAKARAEERAKVEAEFKAKHEELDRQRAALTPSLTDVRGASGRPSAAVFGGPTSLADILK